MRYATAKEMEEIDRRAQDEFGISTLIFMENAGRGVYEEIKDMLPKGKKVIIVCGKGNNGSDSFVAARNLMNNNIDFEIFLIGNPEELKGNAKTNCNILMKMGALVRMLSFESMEFFIRELGYASLIVDAIFGTGLSREVGDPYGTVIEKTNESGKPVLSVDVPSGLDATSGKILGKCIKATKTITFTLPKTGFIKEYGPEYTGEVIIKDISIPASLLTKK